MHMPEQTIDSRFRHNPVENYGLPSFFFGKIFLIKKAIRVPASKIKHMPMAAHLDRVNAGVIWAMTGVAKGYL